MKLSLNLLKNYIDLGIDTTNPAQIKEYCDKMTNTGSKVEGYEILGSEIKNVVIGKIESTEKHPNADKLIVCNVNIDKEKENITIVTGAKNIKTGDIVPVALHNSMLPGGKKIQKGKLREIESNGMLCSLSELDLSLHDFPYAETDGILVLNQEAEIMNIGDDVKKALKIEDAVVEFEITPNRPDCLSVIGLARESAATYGKKYNKPIPMTKNEDKNDNILNYLSVEVKNSELCPRYTARVVKNIKIEPSPLWMRSYLRACGVRPINNIVDITNFIMLEYGQPMHAFDYNYLSGEKIIVRNAEKGEKIITLDSVPHNLSEEMLVIADGEKAVAMAGIMGGENSEIKNDTTTVVFESANFNRKSVRTTAKKLGMRTDSSSRFEKGLDAEMTVEAVNRACELCEMLNAGTAVSGTIDIFPSKKEQTKIKLEYDRINSLLGTEISDKQMEEILTLLDFEIIKDSINGNIEAVVPSYRADVEISADIAEEIARIYGYNKIGEENAKQKLSTLSMSSIQGKRTRRQKFMNKIHENLTGMGIYEIYTLSFTNPKVFRKLNISDNNPLAKQVQIKNPLGEETSVMRTTLLPNMLGALSVNYAHKNENVYLYELSKIYLCKQSLYSGDLDNDSKKIRGKFPSEEKYMLNVGFYGSTQNENFYTLKGILENLLSAVGIDIDTEKEILNLTSDISHCALGTAFHPGRSAALLTNCGQIIGILGEIHPEVADNFDIKEKVYSMEIDIEVLYSLYNEERKYKPLPKYPSIVRDLALICDENTEAGTVKKAIKDTDSELIKNVELFDVYVGNKIEKGKKSLAYSVTLCDPDRTLTDDDANAAVKKILDNIKNIGVYIRS